MMHRLFHGRLAGGLLVGVALTMVPQSAPAADAERVKFHTWDKVEIHGNFFPGNKGNKSPCAIMLHALGGSSDQDGWANLAAQLQKNGISVLTFDFRGHGESTSVEPDFWLLNRYNQTLRSFKSGKGREQISYKDFTTLNNWACLVDDIAAAKQFLDRKNDSGDCNSSHVVVIGAESGATLWALWIATEWKRTKISTGVFGLATTTRNQVEGQDIACAVYLSISPYIGVGSRTYSVPVDSWLKGVVREKVPMYFLYGEKDNRAAKFSQHLCDSVLRAEKDSKLKNTGKMPLKDTKLSGRELLGKPSLPTEDLITKYINLVVEARRSSDWAKRDADRTILVHVPFERFLNR
jgi:alpha-beta hydrolase superfamily lysophospholipase